LISSFDSLLLGHVENLLHEAGIQVDHRNIFTAGAAGGLPVIDVMPELWVEPAAYPRAEDILQKVMDDRQRSDRPDWVCPDCGESIEGQFAQCWHCGCWKPE
jgi:hypothetical protein